MYSRVTLLEIDAMRIEVAGAAELFRTTVLPGLREQDGFEGALVLATPEGKGLIMTLWESEEAAHAAAGYGTDVLERYMALFTAPPGREVYRVVAADLPALVES